MTVEGAIRSGTVDCDTNVGGRMGNFLEEREDSNTAVFNAVTSRFEASVVMLDSVARCLLGKRLWT